jgi:hypothetical protein
VLNKLEEILNKNLIVNFTGKLIGGNYSTSFFKTPLTNNLLKNLNNINLDEI